MGNLQEKMDAGKFSQAREYTCAYVPAMRQVGGLGSGGAEVTSFRAERTSNSLVEPPHTSVEETECVQLVPTVALEPEVAHYYPMTLETTISNCLDSSIKAIR